MIKIEDEQFASLRKHFMSSALARTFQNSLLLASEDCSTGDLLVTDPKGNKTRFSFDEQGYVGGVTSPLRRQWKLESDSRGRPLATIDPRGMHLGFSYDQEGMLSSVSQGKRLLFELGYDRQGLLNRILYPDRTTRAYEYQTPDLLALERNRLGAEVEFEYDTSGLLEEIRDANGHRTRFEYDEWTRPSRIFRADGSQDSYQYNSKGLVDQIVTGSELVAQVSYDDQDRPVLITYGDGEKISLTHDEEGRLLQASCGGAVTKYTYDAQGKIIAEEQDGNVFQFAYNEVGALSALTYPSGDRVEFMYDADQRLESLRSWEGASYRFRYGPDDRVLEVSAPNGLITTIRQTELGLPCSMKTRRSSFATSPVLFSYTCEYDTEARVSTCRDSDFGERRFVYDAEGQLIEVHSEEPECHESFEYDHSGNRTRCNGQAAIFDALNRIILQGNVQCRHDARGNLVFWDSPEGGWAYHYNSRNLLVLAEGPRGQRVAFGYDAFGRRIWKRTEEEEVRYIWAGESLMGEVVQTGVRSIRREFLYVPGTYTPLAMRMDGRVFCYHVDHRGAPIRLTNELGSVVWSAEYSAYGQIKVKTERISNPLRLPGQYEDPETGLCYNRFRYYSPLLGRYLSQDPVSYLGGLNFYRYANNDPINSADPMGLWSWTGVVSAVAAVAVGVAVTAAIVLTAPVSLPAMAVTAAAVVAGGAAAGAVGFGLNEALNQTEFCFLCVLRAMGKGALIGAFASLPFVFLPATAGVLAFMGAGAAGGAIGHIGDWLLSSGAEWSWSDFAWSVGVGAITAGVGRFLVGRYTQWRARGRIFREDNQPRSAQGAKPGRVKSHVDSEGNLHPANSRGDATELQHIRGSEPKKSNSPFTSFKEVKGEGKSYGSKSTITVDKVRLQRDIQSGKVKGVEVVEHEQLLKIHDKAIQESRLRYEQNPTAKNLERLERAQMDRVNSARDREVLVKGVIPRDYVTVTPNVGAGGTGSGIGGAVGVLTGTE